jgi:hypothetical protein
MKLLGFERRWAEAVLGGFAPPMPESEATPGLLTPRPGEVDWAGVFERMLNAGTGLSHFGVRLVFWLAALCPFWMSFRFTTLVGVSPEDRVKYVDRLVHHRVKLISELMILVKLGASMAFLAPPTVRARSSYDRRPKKSSVVKPLLALPIVEQAEKPIAPQVPSEPAMPTQQEVVS